MTEETSKYATSLTYGPREAFILKEFDGLVDQKKFAKSRNDLIRRGLYSCRYQLEIDEKQLLFTLSSLLNSISDQFDRTALRFAEGLAFSIFSIMIVKYGFSKADAFQTVPMNLRMFNQLLDEGVDRKQVEEGMKYNIKKLAHSIETVFLSPAEKSTL